MSSQTDANTTTTTTPKDFIICDVLGGLDVTRLVSTNARNFFKAAIDDVELMREYLSEAARGDYLVDVSNNSTGTNTVTRDYSFSSLDEMSRTLDWAARDLPEGTTSVEAGIGWSDDRPDRRVGRYKSTDRLPLVGDHQTDFDMMDSLSPLMPWIVDRKSRESAWWRDHQNGISEGDQKEPFLFEALYTAAWIVSYAEAVLYYPPLSVYGHPLTMGDVVGGEYDSHGDPFIVPNLPENNPERKATFTAPYPDTALEGVALITATAPVYFSGEFGGYAFDDTFVASLGVDMKVSAVSAFLDVLQDSLTPQSFGLLVDSDFNTIVISQEVVRRIYPERTGMEESRVTVDLVDGSIVQDRRNQTYLPSDTILQDLTKLENADWTSLMETIRTAPPGERNFVPMDITLTGDAAPTSFYVMFESWEYVADWVLLVLAPQNEVDNAINVHYKTSSVPSTDIADAQETQGGNVAMEGPQGQVLKGSSTLVNAGTLDVQLSLSDLPDWIQLEAGLFSKSDSAHILRAGDTLSLPFQVKTGELAPGTQSDSIVFEVQDDDYPDCFFREPLSIPISVKVLSKDCGERLVADADGNCVCASDSIAVGGGCMAVGAFVAAIVLPALLLVFLAAYLFVLQKRRAAEAIFEVDPDELDFGEPPTVVGKGSFGRVYLAEYHGTKVAVKTIRRNKKKDPRASMNVEEAMEEGRRLPERSRPTTESVVSIPYTRSRGRKSSSIFALLGGSKSSNSTTEKQQRKNFIDEMVLLSKLRHPNITLIMGGVTKETDRPMLILEYMDKGSLHSLLKSDASMNGDLIHSILVDIAQGVRFLHNAKPQVLHGDLKSQNILIDSRYRAKVTDFGLTASTPFWMSPEFLTDPKSQSTASDVYALGIVLYEIYSRDDPYKGEDVIAVLRGVMDPKVNKRPPVPPTMKSGVAAMMHDCLLSRPEERPSMTELSSRINRLGPTEVEYIQEVENDAKEDPSLPTKPLPVGVFQAPGLPSGPEPYRSVTLLHCQISNFESIAKDLGRMKADELQDCVFDEFDMLAEQYHVFKVDNVQGSAWMGATNCREEDASDHVKRMVQFAVEALLTTNTILIDEFDPKRGFAKIQIAIHTGPAEGNVIDTVTPRCTLSGNAVETVSLLSSRAPAGGIICSGASEPLLRQQATDVGTSLKEEVVLEGIGQTTIYHIDASVD